MKVLSKILIAVAILLLPTLVAAQDSLDEIRVELEALTAQLPEILNKETSLEYKQSYVEKIMSLREKIIEDMNKKDNQDEPTSKQQLQTDRYVYVLTEVKVDDITYTEGAISSQTIHQPNQLGFLQRTKNATGTKLEMTRCLGYPTQIVVGESIHFQLETRTRIDHEKYYCNGTPGDRWPPYILLNSSLGFGIMAKGKDLHFPNCQELGVKERLERPAKGVPYTVIDPVELTLDESVSLNADFRFIGDITDHDAVFYNDPTFSYEAEYGGSGTLSDELKEGKIVVEYSNSKLKTSEHLENNEITFSFNQLSLVYTLQVNDEPPPLTVTAFGMPAEFGKPHLVSTPIIADDNESGEDKSKSTEAGEEIVENIIEFPDVVGMTYKKAVATIESAGLIALPPELGSSAPSAAFVGRVESAIPAVDGQLHRGDKISLHLFGEAITGTPVPDVVGLGIRQAASAIEAAGFVPAFELGAETTDSRKDQTVARQLPAAGLEVEAGQEIKLIVYILTVKQITLPDLHGMALSKAQQLLQHEGLTMLPELGMAATSADDSGRVYGQSPAPGQEVAADTAVTVQVYGEFVPSPEAVAQNKCTGKKEWDAELGRCVDNSPAAQVARHDCTTYPGAIPKWDATLQQPQCLCPSGWEWSKKEQRCVDNSPRAQVARADCSRLGRYGEAYWNSERQEARCRCFDGYYLNNNEVCVRERVVQPEPPPEPHQDDTDWQQVADDLTSIIGTLAGVNANKTSDTVRQPPRSQNKPIRNCATDITVNGSYVDCNCPGWGFDPKYSKCRQGFSDKYSSNPKPGPGQVYAGFGNSSGDSGELHPCKDPSVRVDAEVLKYAPMYGGGETSYQMKGDMVCYGNSYDKITGSSIEYYSCRQKNFGDCSRQKTTKITSRENKGGGAYTLRFAGGWWTFWPK